MSLGRFKMLPSRRLSVALSVLLTIVGSLSAQSRKASRDLDAASGEVDVIVQFKQPVTADLHQKVSSFGGKLKRELGLVRGGVYTMQASDISSLASDPDVAYVSPDRPVVPTGSVAGNWVNDYHTDSINAPAAWEAGLSGSGVGVAIIDSGISPDVDLSKKSIVYSASFVPGSSSTVDQYGHGTHVAGIIAGNGASSSNPHSFYTFRGIAGGANVINLRVLDDNGAGTEGGVIAAIQAAIALKDTYNIRVINLSLGRPVYESYALDPLCQAVERAWRAGIVVVVAAGNEGRNDSVGNQGYATITSPANDPLVVTVGALRDMGTLTRADDVIATYSSKGPTLLDHVVKPDIVAPGNKIVSNQGQGSHVLAQNYPENK